MPKRVLTPDQRATLRDCLLDYLPKDKIIERFEVAGGDEVSAGRLSSPESSAALAANTFGFFIDQPSLLSLPAGLSQEKIPTKVELECEMRFPWSGGHHAWLDAAIEADGLLVGIESKRYEPFRDEKRVAFSEAYQRNVWGNKMTPFIQMRDRLLSGEAVFYFLDAAQLVKHAFGLRTQGDKKTKIANLLYLYAEPTHYPDGRNLERNQIIRHRDEIRIFSDAVAGAEVAFSSLKYSELMSYWLASNRPQLRAHANELSKKFNL